MMDGFREIEDSPKIYTGTKPKSKETTPTNTVSIFFFIKRLPIKFFDYSGGGGELTICKR